MSKYITVFDDEQPVVYLDEQPWANLTKIKRSLELHKIVETTTFVRDNKTYIQYIVEQ